MSKIRILQFPISANNGVKTYALNNWKYMNKNKFQCDFAFVRSSLGFESEFMETGAGVKYVLASPEREPEHYKEEIWTMLRGNYDVVHLHTSYWKRLLIEEIAMDCRIPKVIVHSHSTQIDMVDEEARKKAEVVHYKLRGKFNTNLATDFCACSWVAADWLFGPQIPREKIKILRNTIEVKKYLFNKDVRNKYRQMLGLEDAFVIGHIGRFSFQKNHDFLIDVFQQVSLRIDNARLILVGEGPLEEEMREKVKELELENKVLFLGQRSDVPQLLQAMDLFCLPSKFEGFPMAIVEAVAAGLPCVVGNIVAEEMKKFDNVLFRQLNNKEWVQSILNLTQENNGDSRRQSTLSPGYDIAEEIREVENLYMI